MKKIPLITLIVIVFFASASWSEDTLFGPKRYSRTEGTPNVYTDTFASSEAGREGKLKIINGDEKGNYRISSAMITVNEKQVFVPSDFDQKVDSLQAPIDIKDNNSISIELKGGGPGSYLTIQVILPFFEEIPGWRISDLTVANFTVTPERANPGDSVTLRATVSNIGGGITPPADMFFSVDGSEIHSVSVGSLIPEESVEISTTWEALGPGKHQVYAELKLAGPGFDRNLSNNFRIAIARVSGEAAPAPELEFADIDFNTLQLIPGQSRPIPLKVRNPSFADIFDVSMKLYIDDEYVSTEVIEYLASGDDLEFQIPWNYITPGEHRITIKALVPISEQFLELLVKGWQVIIPDITALYGAMEKDKWISIGPRIINNGFVGRMTTIDFDPNYPNIIYAGGQAKTEGSSPGVWKTTNAGGNWFPVGDKLPSMMIRSVAVDPKNSNIIYAGSNEDGIFKSKDGGTSWYTFADSTIAQYVGKIAVRYTSSGEVMIYIRCNRGILRYKNTNPYAVSSYKWEWEVIKQGTIRDLVVHPTNSSILYASVAGDGIYYTQYGEIAKEETTPGDHDWTNLTAGLPVITNQMEVVLDIDNKYGIPYAGIGNPEPGIRFSLYRYESWIENGAVKQEWKPLKKYSSGELDGFDYSAYIRVVPNEITADGTLLPQVIYFAGESLYQFVNYKPLTPNAKIPEGGTFMVSGYEVPMQAGVDFKMLEFDLPWPTKYYYSLGDQGIYHCAIVTTPKQKTLQGKKYGEAGDTCSNRNNDLRVTQFYDFDVSKTNPNLIIGGTQDTGTILYSGSLTWKEIRGGDGYYSLINPHNDAIMYSQLQDLPSTARSIDGGNTWPLGVFSGTPSDSGVYGEGGYITMDPSQQDAIVARTFGGVGLQYITDGNKNWTGYNLWNNGNRPVTYVIVHPTNFRWLIGDDVGNIFVFDRTALRAYQVFSHPIIGARVHRLAVSPKDPNILYAAFAINGAGRDTRIWRIQIDFSTTPPNSLPENITSNFPADLNILAMVGDPYDEFKAYVGTEKGVWRWSHGGGTGTFPWKQYNDGFPLTRVEDLLIDSNNNLLAATNGRGAWRVIVGP